MMDARDTFAEALAAQDEQRAPAGAPVAEPDPPSAPAPIPQAEVEHGVVDVRSGEFIRPADEPTDRLAGLLVELRERRARFQEWAKAIDAVLQERLEAEGRRVAVVGDYELSVEGGRTREWDPDDLELVVRELIDQSLISTGEVVGLITTTRTVDGNIAKRLLSRLGPDARRELESCFRWKPASARVRVDRVADLADALPQGGQP